MNTGTAAMIRKLGLFIFLLTFVVSLAPNGAAQVALGQERNLPTPKVEQELRLLAERALSAQYTALTKGTVASAADQQRFAMPDFQRGFAANLEQAKARRDFLAQHQVGYTNFTTKLDVEKLAINGTQATLTLVEHTVFDLQVTNEPQAPKTAEFQGPVEVTFALDKRAWKIVGMRGGGNGEVSPNAVLGPDEQVNTKVGEPTLLPGQNASASSSNAPASPSKDNRPQPHGAEGQAVGTMGAMPTLSRSNIVNYAMTYAFSPNPNYRNYYWSGGDCTNFASQALRNGGWYDVGGWSWSTSAWWYASDTWVNAEKFWWFTYNRPRAWSASYIFDLQQGDILQADWTRDYIVDHTMIVTAKRSDGMPYLTYRNASGYSNWKNRPFWDIYNSGNQNAWYYAWRLYDTVY